MNKIYIVLQAYSHRNYVNEALYLIFSYIRNHKNWLSNEVAFVIYTDLAEEFAILQKYTDIFFIESINQSQIIDWHGEPAFLHRGKIKMIEDFFQKYEGHLLYMDTDTYFLKESSEIFEKIRAKRNLMHTAEGKISSKKNPIFSKIYKFIKNQHFTISTGKTIKIPTETIMWNAGVIGLHHSKKYLIQEILELCDVMYKKYDKHVMEQLSFSYILENENFIEASDAYIFHYWDFKEFRKTLKEFFDFYSDTDLLTMAGKSWQIMPQKLIADRAIYYQKLPSWKKFVEVKIKRKEWQAPSIKLI